MGHLLETMDRIAENDPTVRRNRKIPIGTVVTYHGRTGSMRQGRTEFPAMVLKQHEDDGSLDMIVFFRTIAGNSVRPCNGPEKHDHIERAIILMLLQDHCREFRKLMRNLV